MIKSLGYVTIATAGTPVRATTNESDATARVGAQRMTIQVHPANAGVVYVGLKGMNKTTGVNVLRALPAPVSATEGPFAFFDVDLPVVAAGLNAADFYVDSTQNNDKVIVSMTQG